MGFVDLEELPRRFIAELGEETPIFTKQQTQKALDHLRALPDRGRKAVPTLDDMNGKRLNHHVPIAKRGPFYPSDLANYDESNNYRTDSKGFLLCYQTLDTGKRCGRRAMNRWPRCASHGGGLNPMDWKDTVTEEGKVRSRRELFMDGRITVEDLDDEELMKFGFRDARGHIRKTKNVPRKMLDEFTKAIYERALVNLRGSVVKATEVLANIMEDKLNDPAIRLKAAESILDRNLGKAPAVVAVTAQTPWEQVFESIGGEPARGLPVAVERLPAAAPQHPAVEANVIDVETVENVNNSPDRM